MLYFSTFIIAKALEITKLIWLTSSGILCYYVCLTLVDGLRKDTRVCDDCTDMPVTSNCRA